jgi:mono/diheme cytochrome c family protein
MPGFARQLTDADLSELLSYVRRRFGKPSAEITPEAVQSVREAYPDRADYWSVEELLGGS